MINLGKTKKRSGGGLAKKLLCAASSVALVASLTPSVAFASAGADTNGGWFDLPSTSKAAADFTHTATVNGSSVSYKYMTAGLGKVVGGFSQSLYYILGINGVNFDRGLVNGAPWSSVTNGKLNITAVTAVDGLMGTDVNIEPDEYLWNSCVKLRSGTVLTNVDTGAQADLYSVHINTERGQGGGPAETIAVNIDGTDYTMPIQIYMEANLISSNTSDWFDSATDIATWVGLERQRSGHDDYDPAVAAWTTASGGINDNVKLMYSLADVIDSVTADTMGDDTKTTLVSRYVDSLGIDTTGQKYDSALELAQRYEDFAKATQYYMIGKINQGYVDKKVTAVIVGYDTDASGQAYYACRIYDPEITKTDANTTAASYGSRLANSIMNYSTDVNTVLGESKQAFAPFNGTMTNGNKRDDTGKVIWYKVEDIVEAADAVFVTDAPENNHISNYLAVAPSTSDCRGIYTQDNQNYKQTNDNVNPLVEAAQAAGTDVYYKFPHHLFGVYYAQGFENNWLGPLCAAYLYEDQFTSPENVMAYAARNFWHIKDSEINNVLTATCSDINLPNDASWGTPDSNYQEIVDGIMEQGNGYYLSSRGVMAGIDSMNTGDLVTYDIVALNERTPEVTIDPVDPTTYLMYRLYNPYSGEHFFTASDSERGELVSLGWKDEGTAWTAPESGAPVYRLYNSYGSEHHYTTSVDERDALVNAGWSYEGVGWYDDENKTVPLYRVYNPNALSNNHHFTTSLTEMTQLVGLGWNYEGISWYGVA